MKSLIFDNNEVDALGDDVMNKELLLLFSNDDCDNEQTYKCFPINISKLQRRQY